MMSAVKPPVLYTYCGRREEQLTKTGTGIIEADRTGHPGPIVARLKTIGKLSKEAEY